MSQSTRPCPPARPASGFDERPSRMGPAEVMAMASGRARGLLAVLAGTVLAPLLAVATATTAATPACAQAAHRAVVVVDTGSQVVARCVGFSEDSISGKEALDRAGVDPVYKAYGGMGVFVCSILRVGPDVDSCPGRGSFWAYYQAPPGSGFGSPSGTGVASTRVTDGSVEGWRFGRGDPPPYASPDQVCGAPPPSGGSGGPGGPSGAPATGVRPPGRAPNVPAGPAAPGPTAPPTAPPTTAPEAATTVPPASVAPTTVPPDLSGRPSAARSATRSGRGGIPASLLGFAAVLAALVALVALARRRRRPPP